MKWWENLKKYVEEYNRMEKELEEQKKQFSESFVLMMNELEQEDRQKIVDILTPLKNLDQEQLIFLFKNYLRMDESHAETVALFYSFLNENEKFSFLSQFTTEEKEVILFHIENLRHYTANVFKNMVREIEEEFLTFTHTKSS